jgi:pre-mRNA-processing factor 6
MTSILQVIVACARLFMGDRKIDKARENVFFVCPLFRCFSSSLGTWFNRAVTLDPDFGDAWAHFYKFEQINGSKDNTDTILQRVKKAQPRHGLFASAHVDIRRFCHFRKQVNSGSPFQS